MSDQVTFTDWEIEQAVRKMQRLGGTFSGVAEICLKLQKSEAASEARIEELEEKVEKLEGERDELQEWKVNTKDELQDLKNDNENSGEKIKELENELEELKGQG